VTLDRRGKNLARRDQREGPLSSRRRKAEKSRPLKANLKGRDSQGEVARRAQERSETIHRKTLSLGTSSGFRKRKRKKEWTGKKKGGQRRGVRDPASTSKQGKTAGGKKGGLRKERKVRIPTRRPPSALFAGRRLIRRSTGDNEGEAYNLIGKSSRAALNANRAPLPLMDERRENRGERSSRSANPCSRKPRKENDSGRRTVHPNKHAQ